MQHCISVSVAVLMWAGFHADFVALFAPFEYRYTGGEYRDESFRYRLFVPETNGQADPKPLIVWLHGRGEAGFDNLKQLSWLEQLVFSPPWRKERYPFFLLAVQCPFDNGNWTRSGPQAGEDMINVVKAILEKTLRDYPVDRDRISLAGISSGGTGCWDLAMRYPEYFSAVAPMASNGGNIAKVDAMVSIPVWAFHSARDSGTPIEAVRATAIALKNIGGTVLLTEIDDSSHDCWSPAFTEFYLLDWLLSQRRGQLSLPPGTVPIGTRLRGCLKNWEAWQIIVQALFSIIGLAFIVWIVRVYRSRVPAR